MEDLSKTFVVFVYEKNCKRILGPVTMSKFAVLNILWPFLTLTRQAFLYTTANWYLPLGIYRSFLSQDDLYHYGIPAF